MITTVVNNCGTSRRSRQVPSSSSVIVISSTAVSSTGWRRAGIGVLKTAVQAPMMNSVCQRFLGSVRRECLDHIIILGESHLRSVLVEYVEYVNQSRPHQGLGQRVRFHTTSTARRASLPIICAFQPLELRASRESRRHTLRQECLPPETTSRPTRLHTTQPRQRGHLHPPERPALTLAGSLQRTTEPRVA
jgi:transposase InsO family protein